MLNIKKNSKKVGKSIPDGISKGRIIEIKNVKNLSNSKQFKDYYNSGMPIDLIVSENTKVSRPLLELIAKSNGSVKRMLSNGKLAKY
jgi:hypothetical protein